VIQLARTRGVTELFRDTFRVFFAHAWVFIALSAAVVVPVHFVVEGIGLDMLTGPYDASPGVAETVVPTIVTFLVVSPIITAICIHALRSIGEGAKPSASAALISGYEAFTPLFFAVLLAALGIAAGFALLVVPGIYLFVRWFFVPQAVVIENARGWAALVRSGEVVQGFWWRTLGLVVLINIAAALPALVVATPFASIANSTGDAVWRLVGTILADCVTAPIAALFSTFLYYDLLARRLARMQ
jgi:hypothetical protein